MRIFFMVINGELVEIFTKSPKTFVLCVDSKPVLHTWNSKYLWDVVKTKLPPYVEKV